MSQRMQSSLQPQIGRTGPIPSDYVIPSPGQSGYDILNVAYKSFTKAGLRKQNALIKLRKEIEEVCLQMIKDLNNGDLQNREAIEYHFSNIIRRLEKYNIDSLADRGTDPHSSLHFDYHNRERVGRCCVVVLPGVHPLSH